MARPVANARSLVRMSTNPSNTEEEAIELAGEDAQSAVRRTRADGFTGIGRLNRGPPPETGSIPGYGI